MSKIFSRRNAIEISDDEDEPIYQPFRKNKLSVPEKDHDRSSVSSRDSRQSTSSGNSKGLPRMKKSSAFPPEEIPLQDLNVSAYRQHSTNAMQRSASRSRSPSPSRSDFSREDSNGEGDARGKKESNRRSLNGHEVLSKCSEPGCQICQILIDQAKQEKFQVVSGEVADASKYEPGKHTLDKPVSGKTQSRPVDPTRVKPHFSKKLQQLDATMKVIAAKVDQSVWEEKYEEAQTLQNVLVWLREVDTKLKALLNDREMNLARNDYVAAQQAKTDYENKLKDAVDLSKIQTLLTPHEYSVLVSLKNP